MPTSDGSTASAQCAGSSLPAAALASLREAFAEEVSERLPRLRAAAATLDPDLLRVAVRDAHTLGSSAYVVGADAAARTARAVESVLLGEGELEGLVALVADLDARLAGWER